MLLWGAFFVNNRLIWFLFWYFSLLFYVWADNELLSWIGEWWGRDHDPRPWLVLPPVSVARPVAVSPNNLPSGERFDSHDRHSERRSDRARSSARPVLLIALRSAPRPRSNVLQSSVRREPSVGSHGFSPASGSSPEVLSARLCLAKRAKFGNVFRVISLNIRET